MGTDIHIHVERRDSHGVWSELKPDKRMWVPFQGNPVWTDLNAPSPFSARDLWYDDVDWFSNRYYNAFGVLAGVRRADIAPISDPRGLPDDVSDEVREESDWGHSHSYLYIQEFIDFDWSQFAESINGYVPYDDYLKLVQEGIAPRNWQYHTDDMMRVISRAEMDALVEEGYSIPDRGFHDPKLEYLVRPYVNMTFDIDYAQYIGQYKTALIDKLIELGDPENTRMVFYFDS